MPSADADFLLNRCGTHRLLMAPLPLASKLLERLRGFAGGVDREEDLGAVDKVIICHLMPFWVIVCAHLQPLQQQICSAYLRSNCTLSM